MFVVVRVSIFTKQMLMDVIVPYDLPCSFPNQHFTGSDSKSFKAGNLGAIILCSLT